MTSRFESSAVDRRMPAPPVDGEREVRCPKKQDGVIAAARCLDEQAMGCCCPRAVGHLVERALKKAKEPGVRSESVRAARAVTIERNKRIVQACRDKVPAADVAEREKLSEPRVREIANESGLSFPKKSSRNKLAGKSRPAPLVMVEKLVKERYGTLTLLAVSAAGDRLARVRCDCGWTGFKILKRILSGRILTCNAITMGKRCAAAQAFFDGRGKSPSAPGGEARNTIEKAQAQEST